MITSLTLEGNYDCSSVAADKEFWCRWGCKLSQKLFVGRDYVLKHIKLKHTEKVEDQKSKASFRVTFYSLSFLLYIPYRKLPSAA